MGRRVGVLLGGWGEEREISIKTGEGIAAALESRGHDVTRILAGPGLDQSLRSSGIDVAFLALHGRMGEDGRVQGLLEVLGIPYTGSGVLASALAMNKTRAKELFRLHNLPTPSGYSLTRSELPDALERHGDFGFPCVVKPANGGSSVGLSIVHDEAGLVPALERAVAFGGVALVERRIVGREVTVGVLDGTVLGACEIEFASETFDFDSKYRGGSRYHLPPRLSPTRSSNLETLALAAYRALGCRGCARVDFLSSDAGHDFLLEVNTLPGMTQTSLFPKIAQRAGLDFPALCERLLELATRDSEDVVPSPVSRPPQTPSRVAG